MCILLGTEDAEDFILLVNGLAKIPSLLLIPPVAVGVSESTLHTRGILITSVLEADRRCQLGKDPAPGHE